MNPKLISLPEKLTERFGTRDPFRIASELGITVRFIDTKKQKGMCRNILNNYFIWINRNMSPQMQKMTCAHELGHILLHKDLLAGSSFLLEMEIFDIKSAAEYEANIFAANLLIDEKEMRECLRNGTDIVSAASALDVNVNLLALKLATPEGADACSLPFSVDRRFLGHIEDRADSL